MAPKAPAAQLANAPAAADVGGDAAANGAAAAAAVLPEVEDNDTSTIYVKNLAFATGKSVKLLGAGCARVWLHLGVIVITSTLRCKLH